MALKKKIKFIVRTGLDEVLIGYQNTENNHEPGIVYAPYVVRYKKPKGLRKKTTNLTKRRNLLQLS